MRELGCPNFQNLDPLVSSLSGSRLFVSIRHHQQPLILIHLTLQLLSSWALGPTLKRQAKTHQIRHHQVVVTVWWCPIPFALPLEKISISFLLRPNHQQTSSSKQCVMHDLSVSCKSFFLCWVMYSLWLTDDDGVENIANTRVITASTARPTSSKPQDFGCHNLII